MPASMRYSMDSTCRNLSRGSSTVSTMSDVDSLDDLRPPNQQMKDVDLEKDSRISNGSGNTESDRMLHQTDEEEDEQWQKGRAPLGLSSTTRRIMIVLISLGIIVWLLVASAYIISGAHKVHSHAPIATTRRLTFDDVRSPALRPQVTRIDWTEAHGEDGVYLKRSGRTIELANVNGSTSVFLDEEDIVASQASNKPKIEVEQYWISADMKYVLLASEVHGNFRHSFFAKYWIHNVAEKTTVSLIPDKPNAKIALAMWSPTGHSIVYVLGNNVYVRSDLEDAHQVTHDGSRDTFNGVPDWAYEEEVFQTNSAVWWAPDSSSFAFLKTDEHAVLEYPLEFFISSSGDPELYPDVEKLKYPKPGTSNPVVSLYHYDIRGHKNASRIEFDNDFEDKTRLITEIKWLGAEKLFLRETDRDSVIQKTIIAEPRVGSAKIVEQLNITAIDGGWFEVSHNTHYIPAKAEHGRSQDGYIDVVINDGHLHLALFSPVGSKTPKMLTSGDWEVVSGTQAIDLERGLVYFLSTKHSSMSRHLYSVSLITGDIVAITDDREDAYYSTSFSPGAGYYVLQYHGPGLPWEKILSVEDRAFEVVLQDNAELKSSLAKFDLPQKVYSTIEIDGFEMNTLELRPPSFDASGNTKYPVLFRPYGGPISQTANHKFSIDWHTWLASDPTLEYVTVIVDGRGTGFRGRNLRTPVRGELGKWEAYDQIEAAKLWKTRNYVDPDKFAIWGWSFGGFLTLKVLEADSSVFQYGMAVAPVTDWRFYDSIYTERYMGTVEDNIAGYEETAVSKMNGFRNAERFLIMHGTGDDNVHYQNTLSFVDKLNVAGIENYDMHIFPDSDHSIWFHNANNQVYHRLGNWLQRAFGTRDPLAEDRSWHSVGF